jgi:ligand-binding SRPBCC domain-containing protein
MRSVRTDEQVIRKASVIDAPIDSVWRRITSQDGINDEMGPYLKMTMPRSFRGRSIGDVTPGTRIGKSYLLLFGVIPVGFDDITIAKIEPGRMFREESRMTGMRIWVHHRTLEPTNGTAGEKTIVTDVISVAPRALLGLIPGSSTLVSTILGHFFAHRHRRLARTMHTLRGTMPPQS